MNHIERDDEVTVTLLPGLGEFKGRVCYLPQALGDSWIIEHEETGELHYVQNFSQIVKHETRY